MHCASCEILIEKKLLEISGVKLIDAKTANGEVIISYEGEKPNVHKLNQIFKEFGYVFSDNNISLSAGPSYNNELDYRESGNEKKKANSTFVAFDIALFIIVAFLVLGKLGVADFINVTSTSSIATFFGFGILAGVSSCAALVGGIVLSMSKQWGEIYSHSLNGSGQATTTEKLQPHIMFNLGRVLSYGFLGAILGLAGSKLQISLGFTSFLIIVISLLMIGFGLQMLGVKAFRKFQFSLPKSVTRNIANEKKFQSKYAPFIMGALTFFLPCGFTITTQGLALLSGSALLGGLIMSAFALGTALPLLFIGLTSVKFSFKPNLAERFSKVAGFIVIFFALYNLNNQMSVLGYNGLLGALTKVFSQDQTEQVAKKADTKDLPLIVNGKQVIKMTASAGVDSPNYFKVRMNVPVSWEITGESSLGCNGAIVARNLFSDVVVLKPGGVIIKEFTPTSVGKFGFSCTMGMVRGTIEVVK